MNAGAAESQRRVVYEAVKSTPGLTSAELAERHGLDRQMVARRAPELREAGLLKDNADDARFIRKCRVTGVRCIVWVPM
jgi:DNA-binding IclR family transcriptional regulator